MTLYTWADCLQAARDFANKRGREYDPFTLAGFMFDYDPYTDTYTKRECTNEEVQACDVTAWRATYESTEDSIMLFERWFTSPKHGPVHVGGWESIDESVSLTLTSVRDCGYSMWNATSKTIADSCDPNTWGEFDQAYASREAWEADLATVERMIRKF